MHRPTTSPVTLYVTKRFTSGLLKGLKAFDSMPFQSVERAAEWAKIHRTKPVKGIMGSPSYLIEDASFQAYAR